MKPYLLSMLALLAIALIAGVVVWYLYQEFRPGNIIGEEARISQEPVSSAATSSDISEVEHTRSATPSPQPKVISADSLTDMQRAMLASFGIEGGEFVITEEMITCSKNAIGETRLEEILNGAAPTPFEAVKILPCVKR